MSILTLLKKRNQKGGFRGKIPFNASSGVRTHAERSPADLKSAPLDHSGIDANVLISVSLGFLRRSSPELTVVKTVSVSIRRPPAYRAMKINRCKETYLRLPYFRALSDFIIYYHNFNFFSNFFFYILIYINQLNLLPHSHDFHHP